jgi:NADPH-dependent glutamate synthase beta subunit-like oxidoreductase
MELPATVAVIGGGNTAVDVARSLLRLGIRPAVVYRRTRAEMPAIPCEVDEAIFEDIPFHFLASPARAVLDGSYIQAVECLRMELGAPDASGRRVPIPVPGSEFRIPARGIVAAIGETAALGFLPESAKSELRTGADGPLGGAHKGIFVAGDAATGAGTVAAAVGSGRKVAAMVDAWLRGRRAANGPLPEFWNRKVNLTRVAGIERMNPSYIRPAPGPQIRKLDPGTRVQSFDEVVLGLSEDQAIQEARRCLSCGTCNGCMNCYYFCPDVAIRHRAATSGFEVDEAHCKGCGICVEECPRGAMVLEGIRS